jgi:hypothetical protein
MPGIGAGGTGGGVHRGAPEKTVEFEGERKKRQQQTKKNRRAEGAGGLIEIR